MRYWTGIREQCSGRADKTRRGDIPTPYLVPVATLGSVRALGSDDLASLGVSCALANTYHLHLKPGDELIGRLGAA